MNETVIIVTALASVLGALAIILVVVLLYYRWRNKELLCNFSAFIRENLRLKEQIGQLLDENELLNVQLDAVTGGTRTRDRRQTEDKTHYDNK